MTGRPPKHPDDIARENRATVYCPNNRLWKLGLKDRRGLKALLNALLDDYENKMEQPEPPSKEG